MKENDDTKRIISSILKLKRKESGLSAAKVAAHLGVSDTALYAWENGQNCPSADTLLELCRLYHAKIEDFYCSEPTPERKQLSEEEMELLELWHNATPESRSSVLMVLRCNQRVKKEVAIS